MKKLSLSILMIALASVPAQAQTATYYASHYQGQKTASGVRFNNNAMMAAHSSLPFGTKVKVTNRKTGKSVIVRIVDRCRCSLDLSQSAFRAIGSLKSGRIPVKIKVLN
ncbi:septal ring lytic transglycosylase RlpA family protein [Crocosphaera watsonii]|uniref:Rare lipoprotein A n=5 Tax=Crocosphaera watsonii TaxID=263511 RepID=Q4C6Z7_CROWT|nr:Rare lipoprotein A [Crocosphaera watsonii WH 8501]CCQ50666.1 Rare lipoprotein A precursor [Crocosphaera watsonii WH 8502]CCQ54831.1 Rare lipoprotein A precursor [Crocosphaera watsonii WH 0005]CCQ70028.1 Rare lipoprotein A precursor [Crocosphaera watsonii WH 0402]